MPNSKLVLVVEDDPTLQMVAKMAITRLGYECEAIGSGEEALEKELSDIALIFMDVGLPGIQGDHATTLIRKKELSEQSKRVPIVALTGHAIKEQCIMAGMDDFLQKPALLNNYQDMIQKWAPQLTDGGQA